MIDQPLPYQRHSSSSREAALSISKSRATADRVRVLNLIRGEPDGLTDEAIQLALNMPGSTQRPRRVALVEAGLVYDSGSKRLTSSGRRAVVWKATELSTA